MKFQRYHPVSFAALSAALVFLSSSIHVMATTSDASSGDCVVEELADGDCDLFNNNDACGYDGGDCCECTCVSTDLFTCGDDTHGGYKCIDPSASCVDGDDFATNLKDDDDHSYSYMMCFDDYTGDGDCDKDNNVDECGYDGGDCCECDCVSSESYTCGADNDVYNCLDPSSSCINGYVLASTKTIIEASATRYDTGPGAASGGTGCGENGCAPALAQDGISDDAESRRSCEVGRIPNRRLCEIEFVFEDAQDIMEVQVAFYRGDERSRSLQATINGEAVGRFDSYAGSTFNALGIQAAGVTTLTLKSVGPTENGWISLLEVRFLVEP